MTTATTVPDTEESRYADFDRLQASMPSVWSEIQHDHSDESVVVVPSISLERTTASSGTLMQAMEERALFQLLLLSQPRLRMVYVTSSPVPEEVIEYYLGLLPNVILSHARARLTMVSVGDATPSPLSGKLLARPRLLRHIRSLVPNPARSHLIPYTTTALERDVALALGIPMYAADPRLAPLGSKTGCRQMFEDLSIPCPAGAQGLQDRQDLAEAIARMRRERPQVTQLIVKINEGVSGSGNAVLDVADVAGDDVSAASAALAHLEPEAVGLSVPDFLDAFTQYGGVVEQRIVGEGLASPSVQMRVLPGGQVELLSTHDQLLGGASGQAYLGCIFPAEPAYSRLISEPAMRIGEHLAGLGVMGRFAVDFVVVQEQGEWQAYAIELNLRKGGTTHPFLTLQFLTDGRYDADSGAFMTPGGVRKYLVATDHLEDERLRALTVTDVFDLVARRRLHFDQSRQSGVVFHMLTCVTECGRLGLTAVDDSADAAWRRYREAEEVLLAEAEEARRPT